jgi:hypothetical protein
MGYSTDFHGQFDCTPPLKPEHLAFLNAFSDTRRIQRDAEKAALLPDPIREAAGLPIGVEGANYVGGREGNDASIANYNYPPEGQPSLYCQWVPTPDNAAIEWDGNEKFYNYEEWIAYLIENHLGPWGYKLNGEVEWNGEDRDDIGMIVIKDNVVSVKPGRIVYE